MSYLEHFVKLFIFWKYIDFSISFCIIKISKGMRKSGSRFCLRKRLRRSPGWCSCIRFSVLRKKKTGVFKQSFLVRRFAPLV